MEQQHSFSSQLVEWIKEIIPFSKLDTYVRYTPNYREDKVTAILCTDTHRYSITATPTYLGCVAVVSSHRPGEDWHRMSDLPDDKLCRETWASIKDAIIRHELVKLAPVTSACADVVQELTHNG